RHLGREVEGGFHIGCGSHQFVFVAHVTRDVRDLAAVPLLKPGEIALHARPRQRVIYKDLVTFSREPVGEVRANEPGAAGDQDWTSVAKLHATKPFASSSARASSTRSSASCLATHSASST